jgi:hypothetical protein
MVEAIAIFEAEEKAGLPPLNALDMHWLMQNFVRLMDSMIFDYYVEYEKSHEVDLNL